MKNNNIKWYWPYPITTYYELQSLLGLGVSLIDLGPPLSFDLENVKKIVGDIEIRLNCNNSKPSYIPDIAVGPNLAGQWIRPEDVKFYEEYVSTLYFEDVELIKESTLLHIYKDNESWPGNLNLLLNKINYNVDNRAISEELGKIRRNCKQKCLSGGACRRCVHEFEFARKIRQEKY